MITKANVSVLANLFGKQALLHADSFVNSIAYHVLTGRHSSKVYTNGENYVVTCSHPDKHETTLIFPEIGNGAPISANLILSLKSEPGEFRLARYAEDDLRQLETAISIQGNKKIADFKKVDEQDMDWKYPVRVLDTSKVAAMTGPKFETVRNKFNKVAEDVEVHRLQAGLGLNEMRACAHFWMGSILASGTPNAEKRLNFYHNLFEKIEQHPFLFDGFVIRGKDEPVGFTVWDRHISNTANSLASLSRRSIKGLAEFQIVTACKMLQKTGVRFFNMGGSETETLDQHKLKFRPVNSVAVSTYEVRFKPVQHADLEVLALL